MNSIVTISDKYKPKAPWPNPKPRDFKQQDFNLIWNEIKTWDISVPLSYDGYERATGNHVIAILIALGRRNPKHYKT